MNNPDPNATVMTLEFSLIDDLPGVTPSRQKRSRETTAALLRAGEVMLRKHSLDELSIEALCAEVGATVGAFYSRFESKEVYFNALLELAARDSEVNLFRIQDGALTHVGLDKLCHIMVSEIARWMRNHEGVVRAALQHNDTHPVRWTRFKELGRKTVVRATPLFLKAMGRERRAAKVRAIGFGFQVVFGTLINAVLNDPGPLSIGDSEMATRLGRCLFQQLDAEMQLPSSKSISRSKRAKHK
jgi:AcrR family transcriptional regulator